MLVLKRKKRVCLETYLLWLVLCGLWWRPLGLGGLGALDVCFLSGSSGERFLFSSLDPSGERLRSLLWVDSDDLPVGNYHKKMENRLADSVNRNNVRVRVRVRVHVATHLQSVARFMTWMRVCGSVFFLRPDGTDRMKPYSQDLPYSN